MRLGRRTGGVFRTRAVVWWYFPHGGRLWGVHRSRCAPGWVHARDRSSGVCKRAVHFSETTFRRAGEVVWRQVRMRATLL